MHLYFFKVVFFSLLVFEEGAISMSGSPNTVLPAFEGGRDKRRRRSFNARSSRGNETEVCVIHVLCVHVQFVSCSIEMILSFHKVLSEVTEDSDGGVKSDSGVLVKEEEKEEGVVKFSVYQMYWQSVGVILTPLILISLFLMQGTYMCVHVLNTTGNHPWLHVHNYVH